MAENLPYSVNCFGSHPDENNDDCWTGDDYPTLEAARTAFESWKTVFPFVVSSTTHVELNGPDVYEVRMVVTPEEIVRRKRETERELRSERFERAMEAGMGLGVDAFNDVMGY